MVEDLKYGEGRTIILKELLPSYLIDTHIQVSWSLMINFKFI